MESVLLLCQICPKQPHFSDISHLLTHVSSKGHLAHYFNAQVRSREDISVRTRLEAYDEWYDRNQIESLLSQRLAQKDTKKPNGKHRPPKADILRPVGKKKATQGCEGQSRLPNIVSAPQSKDAIDPQLSLFLAPGDEDESVKYPVQNHDLPPFDLTSLHRIQASHRRPWTPTESYLPRQTRVAHRWLQDSPPLKSDMEDAQELDPISSPSPKQASYPEAPALHSYFNHVSASTPRLVSPPFKVSTPGRISSNQHSPAISDTGSTQLLKLKGPQYPGMALFDSASPNSQRLRNQKKEYSLLAQMEYNAMTVEPIEHIYFPEWTLKKARPITGNVESSPIPEDSPKPKRRRGKPGKIILGELSTNVATNAVRETAKRSVPSLKANTRRAENQFPRGAAALTADHNGRGLQACSAAVDEDGLEWRLNTGLPEFASSKRFAIFADSPSVAPAQLHGIAESHPWPFDDPFMQNSFAQTPKNHHSGASAHELPKGPSQALGQISSSRGQDAVIMQQGPGRRNTRGFSATRLKGSESKENIPPLLGATGHIDNEANRIQPARVTQRYFSVKGHEPPQFFSRLPTEMEFGGFADHRFWSAPYNPLNTHAPQSQRDVSLSHSLQPDQSCVSRKEASNEVVQVRPNDKEPAQKSGIRCKTATKRTRSRK